MNNTYLITFEFIRPYVVEIVEHGCQSKLNLTKDLFTQPCDKLSQFVFVQLSKRCQNCSST